MKRLLLAGVALSVATAASAADMQARPYTRLLRRRRPPAYNRSGFDRRYWWSWSAETDAGSGGFGGGTVGYTGSSRAAQLSLWRSQFDAAAPASRTIRTPAVFLLHDGKTNRIDSGSQRPAAPASPSMKPLLYAKGGYAWANAKMSFTDGIDKRLRQPDDSATPSAAASKILFTPSWSAKAEYGTSLGSETYNFGAPPDSGLRLPHHQGRGERSLPVRRQRVAQPRGWQSASVATIQHDPLR